MRQEPTLEPTPGLRAPPRAVPSSPPPRRRRPMRWVLALLVFLLLAPPAIVLLLRWLPPPTTAYMLQSPVKPVHYQWVPATHIAEVARKAVIAAEDQKFRTHRGFDVEAIEQAYEHNKKSRHRRGASTISQQTAKNLFLWPGGGYFRKGVEAGFTVLLEKLWGKDRILEVYLNVAEFGPGIYGVEAASQAFFGHSADRLDAREAALLASVLPNPRHWNVRAPGPYVQSRANWIMGQIGHRTVETPAEEPEIAPEEEESLPDDSATTQPATDDSQPSAAPAEAPPADESPEPVPIEPESPSPDATPEPPSQPPVDPPG
jgi:monofunctional biosynthetic peptidoglycan transglycosylase